MHTSRLKVHLSCSSSLHGPLVGLFKTREDRVELMFAETLRHSQAIIRDTIEEACNYSTAFRELMKLNSLCAALCTLVCVCADVLSQLSLKQASCTESTLRKVAVRALSVPNTVGAGERTWSTYSFIVNRNRNSLKPECAKKQD